MGHILEENGEEMVEEDETHEEAEDDEPGALLRSRFLRRMEYLRWE